MIEERNSGVTEARFALTLLTCLLVAIGYIALLRFGGTKETTIEVGHDVIRPPSMSEGDDPQAQPRVLPLEQLTKRPDAAGSTTKPELR